MKSKFRPKENPKIFSTMYVDEDGVKQNRKWWKSWADQHNYFIEQTVFSQSHKTLSIRDSRTMKHIKTLTKI